jgi:hypothetical protein
MFRTSSVESSNESTVELIIHICGEAELVELSGCSIDFHVTELNLGESF